MVEIIENTEKSNLKNNPDHEDAIYSYVLSILHNHSTFKVYYDHKTGEDMVSMKTMPVREALKLAKKKFPEIPISPNPTYFYAWADKQGLSSAKDRLIAEIESENFTMPIAYIDPNDFQEIIDE